MEGWYVFFEVHQRCAAITLKEIKMIVIALDQCGAAVAAAYIAWTFESLRSQTAQGGVYDNVGTVDGGTVLVRDDALGGVLQLADDAGTVVGDAPAAHVSLEALGGALTGRRVSDGGECRYEKKFLHKVVYIDSFFQKICF